MQEDNIRPGDSASNVTTSTNASNGSRSSLAKAQAKKAALIAKQKRQSERFALEQQKLQLEAQESEERIKQAHERARASLEAKSKRKMLQFQEENLQLQIEIDEQEAQERVYQQYEEYEQLTGFPHPSPGSHQVSELLQDLRTSSSPPVSEVNAPLDQHVTVRRQVTILDSVNAVPQAVSLAPSSAPTGEANWERLMDGNKDDAKVTSIRVVTPDLTTPGIIRQIPAAPTTSTYCTQDARAKTSIQPTSSSVLAAQHAPQQPALQIRSQALTATTQRKDGQPHDVQFQYPAVNIVPNQSLVYQPVQVPAPQQQSSHDVNSAILALLQQQSLPRTEVLTFDGDPQKYHAFCTSFADNIELLVDDPRQRLTYLIQYCEGKAKDAIKNCVVGGDYDKGYQRACQLLKERFGKPYDIARAFTDTLKCGPPIKGDAKSLVQLASDMSDCETVLEPLQYLREVSNLDVLKGIVNRLPFHIKTKWTEHATRLLRANTQVTFSHLAAFVRERAEIASNEWGENLPRTGPTN